MIPTRSRPRWWRGPRLGRDCAIHGALSPAGAAPGTGLAPPAPDAGPRGGWARVAARILAVSPFPARPALVVGLLLVGLWLRMHGYTETPAFGANQDEVAWAWLGQSLWLHHWPASWSYLPGHPSGSVIRAANGQLLPWVSPWMDHPPLFGLIVGGLAVLAGERTPLAVTPEVIRLVPIALSLVTALLLYQLAREQLGTRSAVLALAAFCLAPAMVESSRLVESEWLIAPMLLGTLLLAGRRGPGRTVLMLGLCLLAPLAKVPGVIVGAAGSYAALTERRWVVAASALAAAAGGIGVFTAYGAAIDWHQFVVTWQVQASRHTGLGSGPLFLFSSQAGLWPWVPLTDPIWTIGMVGLAVMWLRDPMGRQSRMPVAFAGYALLMMLTASTVGAQYFGWYRQVVSPLAYMGFGDLVARNLPQVLARIRAPRPPGTLAKRPGAPPQPSE